MSDDILKDPTIRQVFINAGWTPPLKNAQADVQKLVDAFMQANGTASVRPTDRTAARVLIKAYGVEPVIQIVQVMRREQGKPYCPSINNIKNLLDKWLMVERYLKKNVTTEIGF
jgi:hypothetical protein